MSTWLVPQVFTWFLPRVNTWGRRLDAKKALL